jgi:competence protein ComEC
MAEVIRRFRPHVFQDNGSSPTPTHYLRLIELVRDRGITTILPTDRPRRIELGSVILMVFPKAPENPAEENDNSVGIRVQHGTFSVLLPGDAERAARGLWEQMAPDLCARATVLKLAHDGSNNGTDARWLELVRPELAVASLGKGNEYGHPGSQTLALLERSRIPLLRTDRDGSILVESDGRRWWVVGRQVTARGTTRGEGPVEAQTRHHYEPGRKSDQYQQGDRVGAGGPPGDRAGDREADHRGQALSVGR